MYPPQQLKIQEVTQVPDGIGNFTETWDDLYTVYGYLDLVNGTDLAGAQNAFVEESTHLLVIPTYQSGVTDKMRVVDGQGRYYHVNYVDDPVGVHHHLELYLTYGGVTNGS
jgi:SPP1 family predicted phage head-tail adaptor